MALSGYNEPTYIISFSTSKIPWPFRTVILTASPLIYHFKVERRPKEVRTHSERRPNIHLLTYWHQVER
jgi:hypothetical protein